jgi:5-methyltetrahydropteroyltriglutamate--homocysteine methyltransferase
LSATGHSTGEAARKESLLVRARLSAFRSYKLRLSWASAEERTAVHICYGYGIKANNDWKATLGEHWRQYEETFPALAASRIDQVSLECRNARVPIELIGLLKGKDVLIGCIDVASDVIETPQDLADTIRAALDHAPRNGSIFAPIAAWPPMAAEIAYAKLAALAAGAELARKAVQ